MHLKTSAAAVTLALTLAACASSPPPTLPTQTVAPPDPQTSTREKTIMDLLNAGDVSAAKLAAQTLVAEQPDNREGAMLLMEIEQDPKVLFGAFSFDVTAKEGDTFAGLAERHLRDRGLAYGLARYNGVALPTQPVAGQIVHIPGSSPAPPREAATPARRREAPRPAPRPPVRHAEETPTPKPAAEKPAPEKPAPERAPAEKPAPPPPPPKPVESPKAVEPPKPVEAPKPAEAPRPAEPAKPAPPPHDPAKAAALRSDALVMMNKGDIDHAVGLLRQALVLDPDSAPIKADLERAERIQHGPRPAGGA